VRGVGHRERSSPWQTTRDARRLSNHLSRALLLVLVCPCDKAVGFSKTYNDGKACRASVYSLVIPHTCICTLARGHHAWLHLFAAQCRVAATSLSTRCCLLRRGAQHSAAHDTDTPDQPLNIGRFSAAGRSRVGLGAGWSRMGQGGCPSWVPVQPDGQESGGGHKMGAGNGTNLSLLTCGQHQVVRGVYERVQQWACTPCAGAAMATTDSAPSSVRPLSGGSRTATDWHSCTCAAASFTAARAGPLE
jgi:hypothetical protein